MAERRAVGGPVARSLLAAYFGVALLAWAAAAVVAIVAVPSLVAGDPLASSPVLAVHLVALGALPFAVSGASFHLLPVMLRNDLPSQRALWVALASLCGGFLVAAGLAPGDQALVWIGAVAVAFGLAIVLTEIFVLVVRAPRDRMLIASRIGVAIASAHVVAALAVGATVFSEDRPFGGLSYERWLLIHLHVALLGWVALLIVTVGRSLAPMLAQAPAVPARRRPFNELALVGSVWLLLAGIGLESRAVTLVGAVGVIAALGRFAVLMALTFGARRAPLEAPLARLLVGAFFLLQAAGFGIAAAAGAGGTRLVCAYVILLLVGWAGGVVLGHVPKLLSLSLWVWWPPGPRPKQASLYSRKLGLAETAAFALGVELLAVGVAAGSVDVARPGAVLFAVSTVLSLVTSVVTWSRRAR
ncbi:MAG TPA: hypothetical protein VFW85_03140 [Gaiellaceae bacterium]|nr:hypothetical protein [Gaiellaceae bacterium]